MKIKIEFETNHATYDDDFEVEATNLIRVTMRKIANFMERYPNIGKGATNPIVNSHGVKIGSLTIEK